MKITSWRAQLTDYMIKCWSSTVLSNDRVKSNPLSLSNTAEAHLTKLLRMGTLFLPAPSRSMGIASSACGTKFIMLSNIRKKRLGMFSISHYKCSRKEVISEFKFPSFEDWKVVSGDIRVEKEQINTIRLICLFLDLIYIKTIKYSKVVCKNDIFLS